tara:strand:- start:448 stop:747 length:300 start_codon:yes stop_codon:yes gene_type:complete
MKKSISLFLIFSLITSCGGGFTLKKKPTGDEFLVEKKNPLVLPPDFGKLPLPDGKKPETISEEQNSFEDILSKNNVNGSKEEDEKTNKSLESSILDKIK